MANKPITVEFIADVAQYLREVKGMAVSTEDVAEALVAVSNSGDDLERKLGKAMKAAAGDADILKAAIDGIPKATGEAASEASKDFERIGDDARHSLDGVPDSARDVGRDTGRSFRQSLGEGMSSGRGDLGESISETLGEAIGEAPIPVAAIGLLALGIWNHFKAENEKRKKEVAESFDLVDLVTGEIDKIKQLDEALADLGGGNLQEGLSLANELAKTLGVSMQDVAAVIGGETNPAADKVRATLEAVVAEATKAGDEGRALTTAQYEAVTAAGYLLDTSKQNAVATGQAVDSANQYQRAYLGVNREVLDLNRHLADVDANMDGLIDKADQMLLKAADTNMDGFLDQLEIAKAGLDEAVIASGKLDPGMPQTRADAEAVRGSIANVPKTITVKVRADLTDYYRSMPGRGGTASSAYQDYVTRHP